VYGAHRKNEHNNAFRYNDNDRYFEAINFGTGLKIEILCSKISFEDSTGVCCAVGTNANGFSERANFSFAPKPKKEIGSFSSRMSPENRSIKCQFGCQNYRKMLSIHGVFDDRTSFLCLID
jgi:hypothetical protein